jgi:hypothetical protein
MEQVAAMSVALPSPNPSSLSAARSAHDGNVHHLVKHSFIVPRNTTSGTVDKNLPGFQNVGKGNGQQFITGQCFSDKDCASGCCAGSSTSAVAECIGELVANEPPRTGCGFTSA